MDDRPHLLYIAWGFPPCRSGGVYRALATANAFARSGWRVTVVTADRETFLAYTGVDESLEHEVDPSVRVVRVPFRWPAQDPDVRRYSWLRAALPPVWRRWRAWRDVLSFPEVGYGPWRAPLERAVLEVHEDDPVSLVVATANPHVTFAAAARLQREHAVPFVMDYRDAWLLDVFSGRRLVGPSSRQARWERSTIEQAKEVWFVNEPIRQWHAELYPEHADRMHVVANGWDPDLLSGEARSDVEPPGSPSPGQALRFGYLGTVTGKVPLGELLAGWELALDQGVVPPGSTLEIGGYLGYFAVPNAELAARIESAAPARVSYVGPVPKREVGGFYASVDVLVLALGTGRYVTSGKVFEYLATAKPIVSVHDRGNAASSVLEDYPLWCAASTLGAQDVADALGEAARLAAVTSEDQRRDARAIADRYRRDAQLSPRIAALGTVVAP